MTEKRAPTQRELQAIAGRRRQRAMAELGAKPRAVRRGLARMSRGGRKGEKAAGVVARYEASRLVDGAAQTAASARARDARAGVMPHVERDPERKRVDAARRSTFRAATARRRGA